MSQKNKHQKKQSEAQSNSLVLSVLKSRPVLVLRIILEILGVVMTILFFYPKLTAEYSASWDSSNPLLSTFKIKNESNIGCYAVKCTFGSSITVHSDATLNGPEEYEIPKLCPGESSTIPAPNVLSTTPNAIDAAEIYINLTYHPTFMSLTLPMKSYRFKSRKISSGFTWEPMFLDRREK